MSKKSRKSGLGRGLDALLGNAAAPTAAPSQPAGDDQPSLVEIPVDLLRPGPYQPRSVMDPDRLAELANSIEKQGVVQPIVVRPVGSGEYEIIAGERRWRAAQLAELGTIPAVVRDVPDDVTVAIALIENIQRENLNPLEESTAFKRLIDEFEMTHQQVAETIGRSRAAVSNLLRLQDLQKPVKDMIDARELEMGHARALLSLSGEDQVKAAHAVVKGGLSVRATEKLVRDWKGRQAVNKRKQPEVDPDIQRLESELTEKLAARVNITHNSKGAGKLVIQYHNLDELDGILGRIR